MPLNRTLKQIVKTFESFTTAGNKDKHYQLNSFVFNHPLEIVTKDVVYPCLAMYEGNSSIRNGGTFIEFKMFIFDRLLFDNSNELDVISDTHQIGFDIIQKLYSSEEEYGFVIDEESVSIEGFSENYLSTEGTDIEDKVAGHFFKFIVEVQSTFNNCDLPFEEE